MYMHNYLSSKEMCRKTNTSKNKYVVKKDK